MFGGASNNAFAIAFSSSQQDYVICLCQLYQATNQENSGTSKMRVVELGKRAVCAVYVSLKVKRLGSLCYIYG